MTLLERGVPGCGWQAEQVRPKQGENGVGYAKVHALQQRKHGPCAEDVGKADPGADVAVHALLSGEEHGHRHQRE